MSDDDTFDTDRPFIQAQPDYDVGYGKPPVGTRFRPGQSGNPAGRPKGSKNGLSRKAIDKIFDLVGTENERQITLKENGQPVKVSTLEGVLRAISVNSLKGKVGSQKLFWQIQMEYAEHNRQRDEALFEKIKEFKQARQAELDAAERDGIELKRSFPHPSHIHLNHLTRTVHIDGPLNHVEQEAMEERIYHRNVQIWRYLQLSDLLHDGEHEDQSAAIEAKMNQAAALIMRLDLGLPRVERLDPDGLGFESISLETLEAHAQRPLEEDYALDRAFDPVVHMTGGERIVHPAAMIEQLQSSGIFEQDLEHGSEGQCGPPRKIVIEYVDPPRRDDDEDWEGD